MATPSPSIPPPLNPFWEGLQTLARYAPQISGPKPSVDPNVAANSYLIVMGFNMDRYMTLCSHITHLPGEIRFLRYANSTTNDNIWCQAFLLTPGRVFGC